MAKVSRKVKAAERAEMAALTAGKSHAQAERIERQVRGKPKEYAAPKRKHRLHSR